MNGTKGEGRASEKVEQTWQMDEREREGVTKGCKNVEERRNALPLLLVGRWRKTVVDCYELSHRWYPLPLFALRRGHGSYNRRS